MAQPRRIQLTTLSSNIPLPVAPAPKPPVEEYRSEKTLFETIRFEVELFPPDEYRCPELCYPELVKAGETQKPPKTLEEVDAENERHELQALAKKFEAKYGESDKPRKDRMSDLVDIGDGYDDEDSFIDNSEAYDEFVPSSFTTEHGGFYINCGTLEFRWMSVSDEGPQEPAKAKKRKLKDGGEQKLKKKKKRVEVSTEASNPHMQESVPPQDPSAPSQPTHFEGRPPPQKPRRSQTAPLSLDGVLSKLQQEKLKEFQSDRPLIALPLIPLEASPPPTNYTDQSAPLITLARMTNKSSPPTDVSNQSTPPAGSVDLPLSTPPHGLPSPLRPSIRDLTQAAKVCEGKSKLKFFTHELNSKLLDVYVRSRELSPAVRSHIFTHLSTHLPFSKETLLKRARKLTLKPQVVSLPEALQKLKEAIAMAMPEQISRFQSECQNLTDTQNAKANHEGREREEEMAGPEENEGRMSVGKGVTSPQKRFHWNEEMRVLLCEVVQIKLSFYEQEKHQQSNSEEYLRNFLESEVKPLWPKGWMITRILLKESHKAHVHLTRIGGIKKSVTDTKLKKSKEKVGRPSTVGTSSPDRASSLGMVSEELAALSGNMRQRIQDLNLPPAQVHLAAPSPQPAKPLLGMTCPDPSLVHWPMEPLQPLGLSLSPPPAQAAESEGVKAQVCPHSGVASLGMLQTSFLPASLPSASDGPHKVVIQNTKESSEASLMVETRTIQRD